MTLRKEPGVTLGFMGDGATSQPDFHAAMNFAAVFKVPCVLVCQNNHWSISVPTAKQTASQTIAIKGRAYGMPSRRVDGNDVLAVYSAMREACENARSGGGPTFIEFLTYRIGAHSTSDDPTRYRSDEEVASWMKKDPLDRLRNYLWARGEFDDAKDAALEEELTSEINDAVRAVEAMPAMERASLFDDVYAELPWHLKAQRDELLALPPAPSH